MRYIGEIVELKAFGMAYTTIGMVIQVSPLKCMLRNGSIYKVKSATVIPLRPEVQDTFENEFK